MIRIIFIICLFCIIFNCTLFSPLSEAAYEVTGTATLVDITFKNSDGKISVHKNKKPPWIYIFQAKPRFVAFFSVQSKVKTGSITARLYKEGEVLKSVSADSAFAFVAIRDTL